MDRLLIRQVFSVEVLYLDLECVPIGLVSKSRRVNYLHHFVTTIEEEMLLKFFHTQWKYPAQKNEWTEQVKVDLQELGIDDDLRLIKKK